MPRSTPVFLFLGFALAACGDPAGALDRLDALDVPFDVPHLGFDTAGGDVTPDATGSPDGTSPSPGPEGWIGSACSAASDCDFAGAQCLSDTLGYPQGMCTQPCERLCPDQDGHPVTFCATATDGPLAGQGQCISRCDRELFPGTGCRPGYTCRVTARHNEPGVTVTACVRDDEPGTMPLPECLARLDQLGIRWEPWAHAAQSPDGRPDLTCAVDDPIYVHSPINGITYRYYSHSSSARMAMACELALALHRLGDVLAEHDIDTALHIGTYNCRAIATTTRISQHGMARAIDLWGFERRDGHRYVLEQHWEHDTTSPRSHEAQVLYDIGRQMHEQRIFNVVLTPNYNAAHDNHFHVDLTAGSHFIGARSDPASWGTWYYGPNDGLAGCEEH